MSQKLDGSEFFVVDKIYQFIVDIQDLPNVANEFFSVIIGDFGKESLASKRVFSSIPQPSDVSQSVLNSNR